MTRCELCSSLNVELLDNQDVAFHDDISSLKRSAQKSGCDFCTLCWALIESNWPSERLDACLRGEPPPGAPEGQTWVPQLWLRGQFCDGAESKVWLSCGRLDVENVGLRTKTSLSIFADPGTPAAARFPGRMSTSQRHPEVALELAKEWLHLCRTGAGPTGHRSCNLNLEDDMPTRIIDIGSSNDSSARLVITDSLREPYLALSYSWGPGARQSLMLTRDNLGALTRGLTGGELAAAHRDAFRVARDLGIRYIWIDALCIIQNDTEDWEYESPRMARVYGNALVTISAARSSDSAQGFIDNDLVQRAPPCELPLGGHGEGGTGGVSGLFASLPRSSLFGPGSHRAWCFQEMHLSRRFLVFSEESIFFMCREGTASENGRVSTAQSASLSVTAGSGVLLREDGAVYDGLPRGERVLRDWYRMLEEYTELELSNPHDIFAALSGVAQLAAPALGQRYLAGVWEADMPRGLMWKSAHQIVSGRPPRPVRRPAPTPLAPGPVRRAPSWSWAAVQGPTTMVSIVDFRFARDSVVVRPGMREPGRWTDRRDCGADVLRMPWCELRFVGRLEALQVVDSSSSLGVSGCAPQRYGMYQYIWTNMCENGVLLEPRGTSVQVGVDHAGSLANVKAIGVFDIAHEAVSHVWCLRLFETEGLMLVQAGEGKYARAGWFTVEDGNREWFGKSDEVDVVLV